MFRVNVENEDVQEIIVMLGYVMLDQVGLGQVGLGCKHDKK